MRRLTRYMRDFFTIVLVLTWMLGSGQTLISSWLVNRGNLYLVCVLMDRETCDSSTIDQATDMLQQASLITPSRSNTLYSLGLLYKDQGDLQTAVELFSKADTLLSSYYLGEYYYQQGNSDYALEEWRKAGAEQKFLSDGKREFERGNFELALSNLELAIAIQPNVPPSSYELLTRLYLNKGRVEDAMDAWISSYPTGTPNSFQQLYSLGQIKQMQQNYAEADKAFVKAVELFIPSEGESQRASLCVDIGNSYRTLGQYTLADMWYKRALTIYPQSHFIVLLAQGINFQYQHNYSNATNAFRQAISISPDNATARYYLGVSYTWQCQQEQAAIELQRAIEMQPNNGLFHYELALVYNNLDFIDLANKEFQLASSLGSLASWRVNSLVESCK
ncbi:MAG: tetratricopeptide repeat protein [Anaerolineae bacterium]